MQPSLIPVLVLALGFATPSFSMVEPPPVARRGVDPFAFQTVPAGSLILAGRGGGAASPSEAADEARRRTGGQVLSVRKSGGGYEVKVLTPSGEVRMVYIPASGG
jgi:hypothetical protein